MPWRFGVFRTGQFEGGPRRGCGGHRPRRMLAGCQSLLLATLLTATGCSKSSAPTGEATPIPVDVVFGEVGLNPGQMNYPRAIDSNGSMLWVIDKSAAVQRFEASSGAYAGGWKLTDFRFGKPAGVTAFEVEKGESLLLVPETHYHRISIYLIPADFGPGYRGPNPENPGEPPLLARFGSFGTGPGEFTFPTDVAVLPTADGRGIARLYVSEYGGNDRISAFAPVDPTDIARGVKFLFSFGAFGDSPSAENVQFNRPQSIEIDAARQRLVVTDACNHRVGVFELDGTLKGWLGEVGPGPGQFKYPYGLALLDDGTAVVSEFEGARVQRVDLDRMTSVGVVGRAGRGKGDLSNPWGVAAVRGRGTTVYVLDSGNSRVLGFALGALGGRLTARSERPHQIAGGGG